MEVEVKRQPVEVLAHWRATIKICGYVTDVKYARTYRLPTNIKISKDEYFDMRTGEIKEYSHTNNRGENYKGIKDTIRNIKDLINCNVIDAQKCHWVTLTYRENMTDVKRLYRDYNNFRRKLYRYCTRQNIDKPEYICVVEPQGRGAWHCHVIFIWNCKRPYIPNNELSEMWGQGFVQIKGVANIDNPGAYFSAYLTDLPEDEVTEEEKKGKEFKIVKIDGKEKRFIKGARLHLYPTGMCIVRTSKGIKRPTIEITTAVEVRKKVCQFGHLTYSSDIALIDKENGKIINAYRNESYNRIRKTSRGNSKLQETTAMQYNGDVTKEEHMEEKT